MGEPLKLGSRVRLKVDDIAAGGEAVGRVDNFVYFVPQGAPGDELEVDAATGVIRDLTNGAEIQCPPLPASMAAILAKGGLVNYVKERLAAKG